MEKCQQWNKKYHLYNNDFSKTICMYNNDVRNPVMKILKNYELKLRHQKEKQIHLKCFLL